MTPAQIARINEMRASGMAWKAIAEQFGVSHETIRRVVEPGYREHRNALSRARRQSSGEGKADRAFNHVPEMRVDDKRDGERLLREVPADTRDLTARICGDPLPGRSALDRVEVGHV